METTLVREYTIDPAEADWLRVCRASALQRMLVDAAIAHARMLGVGDEYLQRGIIWMLSRVGFRLKRPLRYGETVRVSTWHRGPEGAAMTRDFLISGADGTAGHATSLWLLYDRERGRLIRPGEIEVPGAETAPPETVPFRLDKLKAPQPLEPLPPYRASYADIDLLEHLNNGRYIDLCCNAVLDDGRRAYVRELRVAYRHEVRLGQTVERFRAPMPDGKIYLCGALEGKLCYEAAVELGNLSADN
ncbi:MAG: thioesterase [Oscillospiraceae bacterium]|nr:thioesterase [Oscillospiraceae bacterium]